MKSSSKPFDHKFHNYGKKESCANLLIKGLPFVLTSLFIATILTFFFLYSPNPLTLLPNQTHDEFIENHSQKEEHEHANDFIQNLNQNLNLNQEHEDQHVNISTRSPSKPHKEKKTCDLFKGHWIRGLRGSSYYTNSSCPTIPDSKKLFQAWKNGQRFSQLEMET